MQRIRIDITDETFEKLAHLAAQQRRPIPWQAEHLIERAVRSVTLPPRPIGMPKESAAADDCAAPVEGLR